MTTPHETWPDIDSFDEFDLSEFPTQVLPNVLQQWVEAEAVATQTPADLPALLSLAVCSTTVARRVEVKHPLWTEPVNLYVAVLLAPANRKSQVFRDATHPLREFETQLIEEARPRVARSESERRQNENRLKSLEAKAAKASSIEVQADAISLAEDLSHRTDSVLPRLIVDDATNEALGMRLAEQGGRIASMSPEGGVFDIMAGLYSSNGAGSFDVYLKGHSGDCLTTDRVGRASVNVDRPAITCAYTIQPIVIERLKENAVFRGRGLFARFLYAAPRSPIGSRQISPPAMPDQVKQDYHRLIKGLAEHFEDIEDASTPLFIELAGGALEEFDEWRGEIEQLLADGGDMEDIPDWGGKLAGQTLRIAAVLQLIEDRNASSISQQTIKSAIAIARYLIPHATLVLSKMHALASPLHDNALYVLRWIKKESKQDFSVRDAHQHGKRRFPQVNDLLPVLDEMEKRGYIRKQESDGVTVGRPPSPRYDVNPVSLSMDDTSNRSQYSQNTIVTSREPNSEDIENATPISERDGHADDEWVRP